MFIPQRFKNLVNPDMHRKTTAVENIEDLDKDFDDFFYGMGIEDTIMGVGEYLR
jgi:cysteine synthase A